MNFLLTLAYDGTNYCGFQVQPNGRSVAATFQDALEAVLGSRPDIKGCSRTDAGVHALGFMLNFHADTRIPAAKLPLALNQHLPPDIRALEARVVSFNRNSPPLLKLLEYEHTAGSQDDDYTADQQRHLQGGEIHASGRCAVA